MPGLPGLDSRVKIFIGLQSVLCDTGTLYRHFQTNDYSKLNLFLLDPEPRACNKLTWALEIL